jgi:hypothetical protein
MIELLFVDGLGLGRVCSGAIWTKIIQPISQPKGEWETNIRFTITNEERRGYSPM